MTDARILTADEIEAYRWAAPAIFSNSHEALRAKLAEADADRADILARRDQVLDDLRQSLEAEIAARKLVEAKLTVAEAERDEARAALSQWPQAVERAATADAHEECARANRAEAALARVRAALEDVLAHHSVDCGAHYCRYCSAKSPEWAHAEHCAYVRSVQAFTRARAALTPAAPEPPKGDPR